MASSAAATACLLNVSMLAKSPDGRTNPADGTVKANAYNLNGQLKDLQMRRVQEGSSIYFIGEVGISGDEILVFDIDAAPSDGGHYKTSLQARVLRRLNRADPEILGKKSRPRVEKPSFRGIFPRAETNRGPAARSINPRRHTQMAAKKSSAPTKSDILASISKDTGLSKKQVSSVFESLNGVIRKSLKSHGLFTLPGLAKMKVVKKPATKSREASTRSRARR
jgi:nucleoid DNA-binding protein